jgi:hypothetical protein
MFAVLKSSGKLFADETTAPVLDPGRGRTKTGQLWAYARDDHPWGSRTVQHTCPSLLVARIHFLALWHKWRA